MNPSRVYADFQNADTLGRVRLNSRGTLDDLNEQRVTLVEGMNLVLYSDDLEVDGEVHRSPDEGDWGAEIDWDGFRAAGSTQRPVANRR